MTDNKETKQAPAVEAARDVLSERRRQVEQQAERIEALEAKCALLAASLDQADRDTKRLDFMLAHDAFSVRCDRGGPNPQYQLMNQDEDEDYHVLHNERRFFATEREAIDEAIAAFASAAGKDGS